MFMQMLGNVKALIGSIGLATAFALLLITGNTLAMTARERRGESGVLRVLGFGRGEVAGLSADPIRIDSGGRRSS